MIEVSDRPCTDREWRGVLGIDNQQFIRLSKSFEQTYIAKRGRSIEEVIEDNPQGKNFKFKRCEDLLFFTLFILKTGVTFDQTGFIFKLNLSNAKRNFNLGLTILHDTLESQSLLPVRYFDNVFDFEAYFNRDIDIIIDGTEQRIQRPKNNDLQKEHYSGKKKSHTHKCLIISTIDTYVHFVSQIYSGKKHDFSILKQEFDPEEDWFNGYTVRLDLGYQGFYKEYPQALACLPHKKPYKSELDEVQKTSNRKLAKSRIYIEHRIGGMKRYEMIAGQSRLHDENLYDKIVVTCAGLWNFFITS